MICSAARILKALQTPLPTAVATETHPTNCKLERKRATSTQSTTGLCLPCSQLALKRSDFTTPPFQPEERQNQAVRTGTKGGLRLSRFCQLCELIWQALQRDHGAAFSEIQDDSIWTLRWGPCSMDFEPTDEGIEDLYGSGLYPEIDTEGGGYGSGIQLIDDRETKGFLRGRLSSDVPNMALYKSWLHSCQSHHVQTCSNPRISSMLPHPAAAGIFTVIDVKSRRLCDMPVAAAYVALSYVWGDNDKPVTLM